MSANFLRWSRAVHSLVASLCDGVSDKKYHGIISGIVREWLSKTLFELSICVIHDQMVLENMPAEELEQYETELIARKLADEIAKRKSFVIDEEKERTEFGGIRKTFRFVIVGVPQFVTDGKSFRYLRD